MTIIVKLAAYLLPLFVFFISLSLPSHALYLKSGQSLTVESDNPLNETVIVSSDNLVVDADIKGDLICAGRNITINSNITGDILCAGQTIKIISNVDGNVRVVGQYVNIEGNVTRNVLVGAQTLQIADTSNIAGDLFFGVQSIDLGGSFGRDMAGAGESINITGSLFRDAVVTGAKINFDKTATVGGDLTYYTDESGVVSVDQGQIGGSIVKNIIQTEKSGSVDESGRQSAGSIFFSVVFGMISYVILGFALIYFLNRGVKDRIEIIKEKILISGLIGFAVLTLTPVVSFTLFISVVGMPLAFVLLLEYILSLITSSLYTSIVIGQWVLGYVSKHNKDNYYLALVVGVFITGVLMMIPLISLLTGLAVLCLGLGSIFLSYLPERVKQK